jgi:hypothetical protein
VRIDSPGDWNVPGCWETPWTMLCRAHVASKTIAFLCDLVALAARFAVLLRHCKLRSGLQYATGWCLLEHWTEERDTPPLVNSADCTKEPEIPAE